ncbi:helix-turn-helix domain-containing protein, partial [Enterococcus sp. LJL90]
MEIQKIVEWAVLLLCLFFAYQFIQDRRSKKGAGKEVVKAKRAKKKPAFGFSFPKFEGKQRQKSVATTEPFSYELVVTLKNGQSRKESFSALEKLTRNEALKEHFIISDGFLMIDGVSVAMGDIAAISLKEKEAFDFFNLPEESLSSAIYDLPEESPTLQDKVVEQVAPIVSGSDVASFDLEQMKAMRLELDLTQKVLGERTGIPQKRISSIERLLVTPTSEELKKIQKELDISFVENSNEKYFAEPDLI